MWKAPVVLVLLQADAAIAGFRIHRQSPLLQSSHVSQMPATLQKYALNPHLSPTTAHSWLLPAAVKRAVSEITPYVALAGISTGASLLVSSLAGASVGLVIASSVLLPTGILLGEFALFGGGRRVAQLMGGKPADQQLTALVNEVARDANMPPPAHVYEIKTEEPNAFAAGFSTGDMTIAVTNGLRCALRTKELKAVIAHEMGHIAARDVRKNMHLAAVVSGLAGLYEAGRIFLRSDKSKSKRKDSKERDSTVMIGLGLMAAGVAAKLGGEALRASTSRHAEYRADLIGAKLYGKATMVSALRKIDGLARSRSRGARDKLGARGSAFTHAYISNPGRMPTSKDDSWWQRMLRTFDTHPTLEQRIKSIHENGAELTV
mmetsp:Transcript_56754/g.93896  ORF Transcript_56754/g.93896 Transcript_56754/m.93896 type:complete len:376 (+) Transcript_56754:90-1217(+)